MSVTSPDSTEPEVLKAMPRPAAIKRVVLFVVIGSVIAFLGKGVLLPWLKGYVSVNDRVEALYRFKIVMFGFGASLLPVVLERGLTASRFRRTDWFEPRVPRPAGTTAAATVADLQSPTNCTASTTL